MITQYNWKFLTHLNKRKKMSKTSTPYHFWKLIFGIGENAFEVIWHGAIYGIMIYSSASMQA